MPLSDDVHMHTWARPLSGALTHKGRLDVQLHVPASCWCGARQCVWYRTRDDKGKLLVDKSGRALWEFCNAEAINGSQYCRVHGGEVSREGWKDATFGG